MVVSHTLTLTRRPVEVQSVAEAKIVDPASGVGYIQLIGFQKTSTDELKAAVDSLLRQGMRHLVLDLRGNPGRPAQRRRRDGRPVPGRGRDRLDPRSRERPERGLSSPPRRLLGLPDVRPDRSRQRQRQRDPGRGASGPRPGLHPRRAELRQGIGSEHLPAPLRPGRLEVDDGQVLLADGSALQRAGRRARHRGDRSSPAGRRWRTYLRKIFGDPETDPVLRTAIQQVHRMSYRAAG